MPILTRVPILILTAAVIFLAGATALHAQAPVAPANQPSEESWKSIRGAIFKDRPILDGSGFVILDAPERTLDAAIVPIGMRVNLPANDRRALRALTLVIDENPAPVAGIFTIGTHAGVTSIATRVRVDSYSYVRLIAEFSDGKLYGVKAYIKASGGCSAPVGSSSDAAQTLLGQMKFRAFRAGTGGLPEGQVIIRHPQNSGLQMDLLTRGYLPAFFIENLKIWQGDELIVTMDGGIAIAEDPNVRFNYKPNGAPDIRVEATDTSKHLFKGEWTIEKSTM